MCRILSAYVCISVQTECQTPKAEKLCRSAASKKRVGELSQGEFKQSPLQKPKEMKGAHIGPFDALTDCQPFRADVDG